MADRATPILLRRSPLAGGVMALYRYKLKRINGLEVIEAHGKQDVTADYEALVLEELIGDDAPDIIAVLDGVADGHELSSDERRQVRAFRERLRAMAERHNARVGVADEEGEQSREVL